MSQIQATDGSTPQPSFVLEDARPLSQSLLWQVQRRYFEQSGVAAWSEGVVPTYVTSNPFIARAYARVVSAYLRDAQSAGALDPTRPTYIVELGAGTGRFAYHFLRKLEDAARPGDPPLTYVLTEYNEALIAFWEQHPALRPLVGAGRLDFAHFDAAHPTAPILRRSGVTLSPETIANPLVLMANYFFDSVPHDAFYIAGGQLHESLVSLVSSQPESDPADPDLLERARLVYERRPVSGGYYGDPELDSLLEGYRVMLDDTGLAFPAAGLRCLQLFAQLAQERLLLVTTDKGYHRADELAGRREPGFEVHGSFSMGVNYHAIGEYFRRRGGASLHTAHRHTYLDVSAFLLGEPAAGFGDVRRAYREAVEEFGPEDFFLVQGMLDKDHALLTVEQVLALLRLGGGDARIFQKCFANLFAGLTDASPAMKAELRAAADALWRNYYHIGEDYDLPYDLGVLLYKLDDNQAALGFFRHSLALHGPGAKTYYNIGLCHYVMGDHDAALQAVQEAARLDPEFEPAQAMARRIQGRKTTNE